MTTRRIPRPRSPRNALLFIREEARTTLNDLDTALVRVERLALEALYPIGDAPEDEPTPAA
jgi:hypothetical protein